MTDCGSKTDWHYKDIKTYSMGYNVCCHSSRKYVWHLEKELKLKKNTSNIDLRIFIIGTDAPNIAVLSQEYTEYDSMAE